MISVLIVDNHPVVRDGLKKIVNTIDGYNVTGELNSGLDIFEYIDNHKVDLIISEIDLPELNGITALRSIKREKPQINILMFSHQPEEIYGLSSLRAGASGFLNKTADIETIHRALKTVESGAVYLSDKMNALKRSHNKNKISRNSIFKRLSTREIEVLKLLSIGRKNKEIAKELAINEKTVSTYKSRLYKKLSVNNIADLIHQAKYHNLA